MLLDLLEYLSLAVIRHKNVWQEVVILSSLMIQNTDVYKIPRIFGACANNALLSTPSLGNHDAGSVAAIKFSLLLLHNYYVEENLYACILQCSYKLDN